jgi:hypothetical protein
MFHRSHFLSHIVQISTQIRDVDAAQAARRRLGLAEPMVGVARLFSAEVTGLLVQLPDWKFPIVCQLDTGQVQYDNFAGRWGAEEELHHFLQAYAVEKTKLEARKKGHAVTEQQLPHGSIKLTIQVAGGAA